MNDMERFSRTAYYGVCWNMYVTSCDGDGDGDMFEMVALKF